MLIDVSAKLSISNGNLRDLGVMVINATFNNISVISWWGQFYWWRKSEYPEKITDLPQATEQTLSHNVVSSTSRLGRIRTHNEC